MTSIKVKFRPSTVTGKMGSIYYQVIHGRKLPILGYPLLDGRQSAPV